MYAHKYRSMQWKGNYYKAGLREGHCLQVVEKAKEEGNINSSSSIEFSLILSSLASSLSSSSSFSLSSWWPSLNISESFLLSLTLYCAKREILYKLSLLLTCKQSSNREIKFSREGSTSPTLMGYKPIQSGDSYDVIRGGHRHIWLVRR